MMDSNSSWWRFWRWMQGSKWRELDRGEGCSAAPPKGSIWEIQPTVLQTVWCFSSSSPSHEPRFHSETFCSFCFSQQVNITSLQCPSSFVCPAGSSWVYSVYPPSYSGSDHSCHRITYMLAFTITTLLWVAVGFCFICLCCCGSVLLCQSVFSRTSDRFTYETLDGSDEPGHDRTWEHILQISLWLMIFIFVTAALLHSASRLRNKISGKLSRQ